MTLRTKVAAILATTTVITGFTAGNALAAPNATTAGVDVSNFNSTVDFAKVKAAGRAFSFVLASDGKSFTSPKFASQYADAAKAGVIRGAYHFARPSDPAAQQADRFLKLVNYKADGDTVPPVLDVEVSPSGNQCYGLSTTQMTKWIADFVGKVKTATSHDAIIYTGPDFWQSCTGNSTAFTKNPLWTADWGVSTPHTYGGWKSYTFWQYSDSGSVDGISGDVDLDRFNGTADALKKLTV